MREGGEVEEGEEGEEESLLSLLRRGVGHIMGCNML